MPIVLLRVDERLIHGQVVLGWGEHLNMDRIVVVDDEITASPWEQELYCLGVPTSIHADFVNVEEARQSIDDWREDSQRTTVLLRDCDTLERLASGRSMEGQDVNLGGLHAAPGRDRVLPYLYLSETDRHSLQRVEEAGARITARDLPGTRQVPLSDLIPRGR
jgi:mannose/fructose/N-acetylgalactosamine-specific phosphotransferase system component IIB